MSTIKRPVKEISVVNLGTFRRNRLFSDLHYELLTGLKYVPDSALFGDIRLKLELGYVGNFSSCRP